MSLTFTTTSHVRWAVVFVAAIVAAALIPATQAIPRPIAAGRCHTQRHKLGMSSTTTTPAFVSYTTSSLDVVTSLRGGEVLAAASLEDVEAILLRAGSEHKLTVIDFSATWCGPCKMIAPLFEEMSESTTNVVFIKVDVDENPDTAAKYNVSAMPTFVFIKGGEVVDRLMGANPTRLQELIDEHK